VNNPHNLPDKPPRGKQYAVLRCVAAHATAGLEVGRERYDSFAHAQLAADHIDWRLWPVVITVDKDAS
jgi:hypothetical protein